MKKIFCKFAVMTFVIGISVAYFSSTGCSSLRSIKGDGNIVSSEKTVSTFEKIVCEGFVEVRFHSSEKYRAVVTVDANLDEYVDISTRNNVLNIGTKRGHDYKFTKFLVDVYCPALKGVSMSGSGRFESVEKIIASTFETSVSGSGRIEGTIECDNFSGRISGSGRISVGGISKDVNVIISGSGNFNGSQFSAKNATVNVSGSGKASICVEDNLRAGVSGSGGIDYCGEPGKVDTNVSGSGRIRKM